MKTKTYKAEVKAGGEGEPEGTFEALVSVFGNVDHAGDRVMPGAFSKSLERWEESGDPIPVVFSHRWDDLDAHVGEVVEAKETDDGLWVKGLLDVDVDDAAAKVHRLLSKRRIKEFSFAYDVEDESEADDGANDLNELDVFEVGPTLKGMNPETVLYGAKNRRILSGLMDEVRRIDNNNSALFDELQAIKSRLEDEGQEATPAAVVRALWAESKAGRVLSSKNETKIRNAAELLSEVLAAVESTSDDEAAKSEAKPEDPEGGKGEEPTVRSPTYVRLLADIDALDTVPV